MQASSSFETTNSSGFFCLVLIQNISEIEMYHAFPFLHGFHLQLFDPCA